MAQIGFNGVSISEVAKALGTNSTDLGTLCTNTNINKWSKHKPIDFPKESGLLEEDWEGKDGDKAIGVWYGLQSRPEANKIQDIHTITYDYVARPKGGKDSPYRLGDFRGYDSTAHCNLYGNCITQKVSVEKDRIPIFILYDENNKTGVDIRKITPQNTVNDIGTYYPCIVINKHIKALLNSTTNTYTPLRYNGAWYNNFFLNIDNSNYSERLPDTSLGNKTVSFLLMDKLFYNTTSLDYRKWQNIDNQLVNNYFVALPDSTGKIINFYRPKALIKTTSITNVSTSQFTIFFEHSMERDKAYSFDVEVSDGNYGSYRFTLTKAANQLMLATIRQNVLWSDMGLLGIRPNQSKTLTVKIYDDNKLIDEHKETVKVML